MSKEKKYPLWFYLILFLIPVILLALLEIGLRLFGYGESIEQWYEINEKQIILNPDIAKRYFSSVTRVPTSISDAFDKEKKEESFRVFVFGESSAAGYPYMPNGSFSKYLEQRLRLIYPENKIEVVNLGITATNSYTWLDLIDGVIEQKPDLIIFYGGHNEYYGALGVGSMESIGNNRFIIKTMMNLYNYRTAQLLKNILRGGAKLLSGGKDQSSSGTLMSRMAEEQFIEYRSNLYNRGIEQFESNMQEILQAAKEHNIPVILGTPASNLRDIPPFVSIDKGSFPSAKSVYDNAVKELNAGNIREAGKLFRQAKDLDGLKFRAPEEINSIIHKLARQYGYPVAEADSAINSASAYGIAGNDLMTDHLHPTLNGYFIIGKVFFDAMAANNMLPPNAPIKLSSDEQDKFVKKNFYFSELDSVVAAYRITILKNDWPYVPKGAARRTLLHPKNFLDSLAIKIVNDEITWERGHRLLGSYYLSKGNIDGFYKEYAIVINKYPFIMEYYNYLSEKLIEHKEYEKALTILEQKYNIEPDLFSTKWIGTINLSKNNYNKAIRFLEESIKYDATDAQVFYNLSGAYAGLKNYTAALNAINKCLALNASYPRAGELQAQLIQALK